MSDVQERYRKIGSEDREFDIAFWQAQGAEAIFAAALDMVVDSLIIRNGHADKPDFQRSIESYGKI